MTDRTAAAEYRFAPERVRLGILVFVHVVVTCLSLVAVAQYKFPVAFDPTSFHIFFDLAHLPVALLAAGSFMLLALPFVIARFSFGYFVGFYLYTMVLAFIWLNIFTDLTYDHRLAGLSAAASAAAFLLPALFITAPIRQIYVLSEATLDRLLTALLILGFVTVAAGASYNFRLVGIEDIYDFREKIGAPTLLNYLIGMSASALLPFAFAGFLVRKAYWRAAAVLFVLLCVYPIALTKSGLLTPFWLVGIAILSKLFAARIAVVLSLLAPVLAVLILIALFGQKAALIFSILNFRMIAVPAVALGVYTDFFSTHDLTYFCQISFLKPMMHCPYQEQLSQVMEKAYKLGNFNASLVAEGIASVGVLFAPVAVLAGGLIIAIGNRLSAGLPPAFILISGAVIPQLLLNVALSTVLLTHGAGLLFLLWYITPRTIFERKLDEAA
jgi:hypothetical protein